MPACPPLSSSLTLPPSPRRGALSERVPRARARANSSRGCLRPRRSALVRRATPSPPPPAAPKAPRPPSDRARPRVPPRRASPRSPRATAGASPRRGRGRWSGLRTPPRLSSRLYPSLDSPRAARFGAEVARTPRAAAAAARGGVLVRRRRRRRFALEPRFVLRRRRRRRVVLRGGDGVAPRRAQVPGLGGRRQRLEHPHEMRGRDRTQTHRRTLLRRIRRDQVDGDGEALVERKPPNRGVRRDEVFRAGDRGGGVAREPREKRALVAVVTLGADLAARTRPRGAIVDAPLARPALLAAPSALLERPHDRARVAIPIVRVGGAFDDARPRRGRVVARRRPFVLAVRGEEPTERAGIAPIAARALATSFRPRRRRDRVVFVARVARVPRAIPRVVVGRERIARVVPRRRQIHARPPPTAGRDAPALHRALLHRLPRTSARPASEDRRGATTGKLRDV